jgi:NADH-quinone oxidoreductase subunit H
MMFQYPLAGTVLFLCLLGKLEVPPFHVPGAKQEIVSGCYTEYSGFRLGFIELTKLLELFVGVSLFVMLFLGGAANLLLFVAKSLVMVLIISLVSVRFARLTIGHAFRFYFVLGLMALIEVGRALLA